jgi:hypothetical protein
MPVSMLLPGTDGSRQVVGVNSVGINGMPLGVSPYGAYPGLMQVRRPGLVPVANSYPPGGFF